MVKANDFIKEFENVKKTKYNGEVLYNVLLEEHDKMLVNNLICETLHPDNILAKLYNLLSTLNAVEQNNLITRWNANAVKDIKKLKQRGENKQR